MAGGGARAGAVRAVILLDTNVVSAVMRQRPEPAVVAWLDRVDPREVWLPRVVVVALRYGAALHPDATRRCTLEHNFNRLIGELIQERIASLDAASTQKAALLAAQRKAQGRSDTGLSLINPFPATPSE